MVSSTTMIMMLMVCATVVLSSHDDWHKLQRSDPLSPISLVFGVKRQVIGDEEGSDDAIELAGRWLLANGVNASEFIAVQATFIEVGVPIAVAERLLGINYYDYQNGESMIHRVDGREFVIPQSAVHFLDYVWPTVLREENDIVEEFVWAEEGEDDEEEGDRRRLAMSTRCSQRITAASFDKCGSEYYTYCHNSTFFGLCIDKRTTTRARTCEYTIYRDNCPCCKGTSYCECTANFLSLCLPRFGRHTCAADSPEWP